MRGLRELWRRRAGRPSRSIRIRWAAGARCGQIAAPWERALMPDVLALFAPIGAHYSSVYTGRRGGALGKRLNAGSPCTSFFRILACQPSSFGHSERPSGVPIPQVVRSHYRRGSLSNSVLVLWAKEMSALTSEGELRGLNQCTSVPVDDPHQHAWPTCSASQPFTPHRGPKG